MIKQPNNWNEVKEFTEQKKLPLDAYVCRIINAEVQGNTYGEQLCIVFDIAEGEHTGFFKQEFNASTFDNKKYKGVLRIWLPKHDGSQNDEITKRVLKGMVTAVETSNPGYKWNWEEKSLVGRSIGILFRNEEWDYNGKQGWAVRPFRAISTDNVRSGDYSLPKDKPLKNKPADSYGDYGSYGYSAPASDYAMLNDDDAQLPF